MKIGNVELKNQLILAPMAGATTSSFRTICHDHGASLVVSEMISDKAILFNNKKTIDMLIINKTERPISIQIFGSEHQSITQAAKIINEKVHPDLLDVNMGCPVPKVFKGGAGSALLKNSDEVYNIVKSLKDNIDIPVTIKIRAGIDNNSINCDEIAKIATKANVDAIAIHARTRTQLYSGKANYEYIKMVRENTDKIVIGNGDIKDYDCLLQMKQIAHPDFYMIGRSALGNPWIFDELNAKIQNREYQQPTIEEILGTLLLHARSLVFEKGEHLAMIEMRTMAPMYLKNLPYIKPFRVALVQVNKYQDLEKICNDYYQSIKSINE